MFRFTARISAVTLLALLPLLAPNPLQAATACWEQTTTKCCQQAGAALTVDCEIDGEGWTCSAKDIANPVIQTVKKAANGFRGYKPKANGEHHCEFKKPKCGATVNKCEWQGMDTKLVCEEKVVSGTSCQTPPDILSHGDGSWDLNFAMAVDGQPYQFNIGGHTCSGEGDGTELVP